MRIFTLVFLLLFGTHSQAEEACPKYRNGCVPLQHFQCGDVAEKEIERLCYNERARYMVIWLLNRQHGYTPYHYCDVGPGEITSLKSAPSMYNYYLMNIRSKPNGNHGPYDCQDHPVPTTFD